MSQQSFLLNTQHFPKTADIPAVVNVSSHFWRSVHFSKDKVSLIPIKSLK